MTGRFGRDWKLMEEESDKGFWSMTSLKMKFWMLFGFPIIVFVGLIIYLIIGFWSMG